MYCIHCGKEIVENAKFCNFCGKNLQERSNGIKKSPQTSMDNDEDAPVWKNWEKILVTSLAVVIIAVLGVIIYKANSIEGQWYLVREEEGRAPETYFNFMSDGTFVGDGASGGTYGAQDGDLFLQYNPLVGNRTYEYELKWGKLYIYNNSKVYVYSRINPGD